MALMEERNLINKDQAGFRKDRCTTDQITKLVQMASDQMQEKKTKKKKRGGANKRKSDINGNDQSKKKDDDEGVATIVTFFDFERAYDKVWREGLIHKMIKLGIPYSFIKYTRHFLSARRTAVEINNKRSPEFYLNEGLPQGSAISPLLFLIFINDITEYTKDGSTLSLFADDTAAWVFKGENKEEAERKMQENIDAISRWADDWKMTLNTDKTKVMVISSNSKDHKWKPSLFLKGEQLEVVKEYKFLGVIIDNQLRFNSHVAKTVAKCKRRNNLLRCLAGKDWGQSMESQKTLYVTYIRSALEYASPSWYPWISETARGKLEVVQNDSMRIMTRMAKKTPIDFLRLESGLEPLEARMEKNSMVLWEKYVRFESNDQRHQLAVKKIDQRLLTRHGWRKQTETLGQRPLNRNTPSTNTDPMLLLAASIQRVKLTKKKEEYPIQELARLAEMKIAEIDAEVEIFTDGSTSGKK